MTIFNVAFMDSESHPEENTW